MDAIEIANQVASRAAKIEKRAAVGMDEIRAN